MTNKRDEWEEDFQVGALDEEEATQLDMLLIIYVLQHPLMFVARIPLFIVYTLLTCCCDKSPMTHSRKEFKDLIISLDYVKYQYEDHNNFENHHAGMNDLQF